MPIGANTLRVLRPEPDPEPVRVRDLPRLTGVSKEANAMCTGWLERHGCAEVVADPSGGRGQVVRLTAKGRGVQAKHRRILDSTEAAWRAAYGAGRVDRLVAALAPIVGDGTLTSSPLAVGLEPSEGNWRASAAPARHLAALPHGAAPGRVPRRQLSIDARLVAGTVWQAGPVHPFRRADALRRLADEEFDVLVVGGGITGAGVALDAASRGLRTALVEQADFASGTSSKSSKMVHGGIRYLQQREFRLVYENLAERQRLLQNAPHLVSPLPFLIPLFGRDGVVSKTVARSYSSALWMYDLTGGWRIGHRHHEVGP